MGRDGTQLTRRTTLKRIGVATTVGGFGLSGVAGTASATETAANLTATEITSDGATFTWDDVGGQQYYLYWQNSDTGEREYRGVSGTEATLSLSTGVTYFVWLGVQDDYSISWQGPVRVLTQESEPESDDADDDVDEEVADIEAAIHDAVNRRREDNGLSTLSYRDDIATVARDHSQYMADQGRIMHTQEDGDGPGDRLEQDGIVCRGWGENVLQNYQADESATDAGDYSVQQWMDSSGHRENILTEAFTVEGVGVALTDAGELYATQVLGIDCR